MTFVLAARRQGYEEMAPRLARATGSEFHFIGKAEELTLELLDSLKPEMLFFPHWSTIIPATIHEKYSCVVFHMTDLPYGRGGSPLQNLIIRGHRHTMLSALQCTRELDAGPIFLKKHLSLEGTAEEIYARGAALVEEMILDIVQRRPIPEPQEGEPVFFKRRTPDQSNLAGLADPDQIFDHIRMLDADGYPHAFLECGGMRLEFTQAVKEDGRIQAQVRIKVQEGDGGDESLEDKG